jgi:hypothetical protein
MRILLVRDRFTPPWLSETLASALFLSQLVRQAAEAGHQLRELAPNVTAADKGGREFLAAMRLRLDGEVADFDPQVIHLQGIGLLGHLALESGVPYLILALGEDLEELTVGQDGSTLHTAAQQAVENAGRIVVDSPEARRRVLASFGELDDIVVSEELATLGSAENATDPNCRTGSASLDWLWNLYREIVTRRRRPAGGSGKDY